MNIMNVKKIVFSVALATSIFCNIISLSAAASSNTSSNRNSSNRNRTGMEVRYEGAAKKLVTTSENFFEGFQTMLPGDKITETVYLNNDSLKTVDFYFRTDLEKELKEVLIELGENKPSNDPLSRAAALLRETILTIEIRDQNEKPVLIYKGNLAATILSSDFRRIGHYEKNEKGTFTFTLELPSELTNIYSNNFANVIWIFGVQEVCIDQSDPSPEEPTNPSCTEPTNPCPEESTSSIKPTPSPENPSNPSSNSINPTSPTTPSRESGDRDPSPNQILGIENYKFYIGIILVVVSVVGLIILAIRRKR